MCANLPDFIFISSVHVGQIFLTYKENLKTFQQFQQMKVE